jgi:hypothetical protein
LQLHLDGIIALAEVIHTCDVNITDITLEDPRRAYELEGQKVKERMMLILAVMGRSATRRAMLRR